MTLRERYNLYIYIKPKLLKLSQFSMSAQYLNEIIILLIIFV